MGTADDDGPDTEASQIIGSFGIIIFVPLLLLTARSALISQYLYSRLIFISCSIVSILEIPRYATMIVEGSYSNQGAYVAHMFSSLFFFSSFSGVCYLLHDAADTSQVSSPLHATSAGTHSPVRRRLHQLLFDRWTLVCINMLFGLLVVVTSVLCMDASSLSTFFHHSRAFSLFTYVDALKSLFFSSALLIFGFRLRHKIRRFTRSKAVDHSQPQEQEMIRKLNMAVQKLVTVMIVCTFAFLLRTVMLIVKSATVEERNTRVQGLPEFGIF